MQEDSRTCTESPMVSGSWGGSLDDEGLVHDGLWKYVTGQAYAGCRVLGTLVTNLGQVASWLGNRRQHLEARPLSGGESTGTKNIQGEWQRANAHCFPQAQVDTPELGRDPMAKETQCLPSDCPGSAPSCSVRSAVGGELLVSSTQQGKCLLNLCAW